MAKRNPPKTWGLISAASIPLIMTLGNSMLIPVIPQLERQLDISPFMASMVITAYSVVAILLIPLAGYLSDRLGRKAVIVPSLITAGVGGAVSGWAAMQLEQPYAVILLGRLLQGAGAAGAAPIVLPLIGDMFDSPEEVSRGLGLVETANTFGKVLSPILGAFLAALVWYLPFFAIPVFCALSTLLVLVCIKAPKNQAEPPAFGEFLASIKAVFAREGRWLVSVFAIGATCMFILFGELFFLSSLLEEEYGIDGVSKGLYLAIPLAALCIASYLAGRCIGESKPAMKWITVGGMAAATLATLFIGFPEHMYWLIAELCLTGVGIGAALPSLDAMITQEFDKEERGTITALYSSMRFLGVAAGPPVFALLMALSYTTLRYTVAGVCLAAAVFAWVLIRPPASGKAQPKPKPKSKRKRIPPWKPPV